MSFFDHSLYSLETARRVALLPSVCDREQCDEIQRWLDEQDENDANAKLWQMAVDEKGDDGE